jgi:GTP-binding protein
MVLRAYSRPEHNESKRAASIFHPFPLRPKPVMNATFDPQKLPQVAIIGRPNVGKSSLFNRIVGRRQAIVGSLSGLTRDRQTGEAEWIGTRFVLTDTGGLEWDSSESLLEQVKIQVLTALETSDVVMFVVDGRDGLTGVESEVALFARRHGIPMLLVINKCDTREMGTLAKAEFSSLGISPVFSVSAEQGRGVGDMLDGLVAALPEIEVAEDSEDEGPHQVRIAVIGRPNVGKSSLVNALLGTTRVIVSDIPGTTRDAIDTVLERDGRRYVLVDTAGMRKRAKVDTHAEMASVAIAKRRIERADVSLLLIEPHEGVTHQDITIGREAQEHGCGLIVVVNKWDTVDKEEDLEIRFTEYVRRRVGRLRWAPLAYTSALEGLGVEKLLPLVDEVAAARARRIPTAQLNVAFEKMLQRHEPAGGTAGAMPKYLTQVGVNPPSFVVFASGRGAMRADYRRYIENRLRDGFEFAGAPLRIKVRR